jgi:hypothetical protein
VRKTFAAIALAATFCVAGSASADPLSADTLGPHLGLGLKFGGGQKDHCPLRFSALIDVRSHLMETQQRVVLGPDSDAFANVDMAGMTLFDFDADRQGVASLNIFGHDVLADARLQETGSSNRGWMWWTIGGAAAIATGVIVSSASHAAASDDSCTGCPCASSNDGHTIVSRPCN